MPTKYRWVPTHGDAVVAPLNDVSPPPERLPFSLNRNGPTDENGPVDGANLGVFQPIDTLNPDRIDGPNI
jgi:hypothetical protein